MTVSSVAINFNQCYDEWKILKEYCLVLLHGAPPLWFTVTLFPATPTNSLSLSLGVYQCNKRDMWNSREQNCFCINMFYFNCPNFLNVGITDITFQSTGTGKFATPHSSSLLKNSA